MKNTLICRFTPTHGHSCCGSPELQRVYHMYDWGSSSAAFHDILQRAGSGMGHLSLSCIWIILCSHCRLLFQLLCHWTSHFFQSFDHVLWGLFIVIMKLLQFFYLWICNSVLYTKLSQTKSFRFSHSLIFNCIFL